MKFFNNLKLGARILTGFFIVAIIVAVIGIIAVSDINTIHNSVTAKTATNLMLGIVIVGVLITIGLGVLISISVTKPIKKLADYAGRLALGDADIEIINETKDEIGTLMVAFKKIVENIKEQVNAIEKIASGDLNVAFKVKSEKDVLGKNIVGMVETIKALLAETNILIIDSVPFPIHVTDNDMKWTYMNKAFEKLMIEQGVIKNRESAYGMPCCNAGASICNTGNCGIKQLLQGNPQSFFDWSGMQCKQDTGYLKNSKGENIGFVETITDLTSILSVSNYTKIEVERLEGNLELLSHGNLEFDLTTNKPGKYTVEVKKHYDEINNRLKLVKNSVQELVNESRYLAESGVNGNLELRSDASKFEGGYRDIVSGFNKTLDAIEKPINEASAVLQKMSEGDLTSSMEGEYKGSYFIIKDSINSTLNSFNEMLTEINDAADQVSSGSNQVSDGSQALSQGTTEQASSIEELTSSITEVAAQTKENAVSAGQANELALSAKEGAVMGNSHMKEMLKSMEEINESSTNIKKIIKVIDDIAFQTNILALNAAVEAARAGKHGKGFAVVAEEVRNLAARSANAAKETTDLIEGSIKKVEFGTKIANNTAESLDQIVSGVSKVATLVGNIATASNEQATAIFQINKGIEQVSDVVQTNSATAEQSAAASEELSSQASMLKNMVGKFRLKRDTAVSFNVVPYGKQRNQSQRNEISLAEAQVAATTNKPQISLSNRGFGKY